MIRWAEGIGLAKCPYMIRYYVTFFGYSLRLHHWLASDDQRHLHDHPWWMLLVILKGGYTDMNLTGQDLLTIGSIRFRRANYRHTVKIAKEGGGCWSLLVTGRPTSQWGFYVPTRIKRLRPLRYFSRYGHHPCE